MEAMSQPILWLLQFLLWYLRCTKLLWFKGPGKWVWEGRQSPWHWGAPKQVERSETEFSERFKWFRKLSKGDPGTPSLCVESRHLWSGKLLLTGQTGLRRERDTLKQRKLYISDTKLSCTQRECLSSQVGVNKVLRCICSTVTIIYNRWTTVPIIYLLSLSFKTTFFAALGCWGWSLQSVFHRFPCWKLLASVLFLLMEGTNGDWNCEREEEEFLCIFQLLSASFKQQTKLFVSYCG